MNHFRRQSVFSPEREYRYTLWREWGICSLPLLQKWQSPEKYVQFIGLNPSTADELQDDPTVRRCINFAKAWGYGAMCMTNIFAFRATDPKRMKREPLPVGAPASINDSWLLKIAFGASITIAAWGKDGAFRQRQNEFLSLCRRERIQLHHLGLNNDGTPKHPLYLKATILPTQWLYESINN